MKEIKKLNILTLKNTVILDCEDNIYLNGSGASYSDLFFFQNKTEICLQFKYTTKPKELGNLIASEYDKVKTKNPF
jgi:hypothetical protein